MENPRPTYTDIVLAYLEEGYRAWQARDGASADVVRERMELDVTDDMDFRKQLESLGLIAWPETHDDPGDYRLLPNGIALMDGSPTLDSVLTRPLAMIERIAPTTQEGKQATIAWKKVVTEWAIKEGMSTVWGSRQLLWGFLRTQFPWVPALWPEDVS